MSDMSLGKMSADLLKRLSVSGSGRYDVAFKDDLNEVWIVYNSASDSLDLLPFGKIAITPINTGLSLDPENPNYHDNVKMYIENGISPSDVKSLSENAKKCRQGLDDVKNLLLSMPRLKAELSPLDYEGVIITFWYKYAAIYDFENWLDFFADVSVKNVEGFPDTQAYRAFARFNSVYSDRCVETIPATMIINSEAITGRVFLLDPAFGIGGLFPIDLMFLLRNAGAVHVCARCGQLYLKNNLSSRYCPECKYIVGSKGIINENRRKNKARYLHKRILDKLNSKANTRVNPADFRAESNYYWAVVNGKQPKIIPKVASPNVKTEAQYIAWLESVLPDPYRYLNHRYDD